MMPRRRTAVAACVVMLCCSSLTAAERQDPPAPLRDVGIDQRLDQPLPLDLPFTDERGKPVRLGDYFGKQPVILSLVYYECPMLCSIALDGLVRSLRALSFSPGKEFQIITLSFDPKETAATAAAKKAAYLKRYHRPGAETGWHFLTGDAASIATLTESVGFRYRYDEATRQYAHASALILLTPQGRTARYFPGVEYAPKDLRLALVEASAGRIGTPIDQLLLYCYHYDPVAGRYGLAIMKVLRLAAAATVLMLAGFIAVMVRRERRAAAGLHPSSELPAHAGD